MVLCKTFEVIIGGNGYVLSSCFYVLSRRGMVSGTLDYVICVGRGIYITECKHELDFPWKSNVVLGLCGFEDFEKKKEANGLKRERLERSNPLQTSSLSMMKKVVSYVVTG